MEFRSSKKILFIIFLFTLVGIISNPIISNKSVVDNSYQERLRSSQGTPAQNVNIEIDSSSQLIWISGKIILNLDSSINGLLDILLMDTAGGAFFQPYITQEDIISTDNNRKIEIPITLQMYTFPGKYNLELRINYLESSGAPYHLVLSSPIYVNVGLGLPVLILILFIIGICSVLIISKKEKIQVSTSTPGAQQPPGLQAPQGKIKCPECKKTIEEGITFCPECGIRIPEFLRYNPDSSTMV